MYSVENTKGMCQHLYKLSQIVIRTLCNLRLRCHIYRPMVLWLL